MKSLFLPCCLIVFLAQTHFISALIHSSQPENGPFNLSRPIIHQEEEEEEEEAVHGFRSDVGTEMERTLQEKLLFDSRKAQGGRGGGSTIVHQPRSSKSSATSLVKQQFHVSSAAKCLTFSFALAFALIL